MQLMGMKPAGAPGRGGGVNGEGDKRAGEAERGAQRGIRRHQGELNMLEQ